MSESRPWHRLFGLSLIDFFHGMPVTVEIEKDLSLKQQWLDAVVLRRTAEPLPGRMPDGFEELADHNLITFKSYQEALDGWALNELIGHYVNYRKQVSPSMQDLLPETDFRLFAVCVRFPQGLARQTTLTPVQAGVYEVSHFTGRLRVVVVHELPPHEHNAVFHLFSAQSNLVPYGSTHYRPRSPEISSLLRTLFIRHRPEDSNMASMLERILHDEMLFQQMKPEEVLKQLHLETMALLTPEERLKGLTAEQLLAAVPPEERLRGLSVDQLLAALSPEARAALAQRLRDEGTPPNPDGR